MKTLVINDVEEKLLHNYMKEHEAELSDLIKDADDESDKAELRDELNTVRNIRTKLEQGA